MNREITFRGKRIDNGEWVEGFYFQAYNDIGVMEAEYKSYIIEPYIFVMSGLQPLSTDRLAIADFVEVHPETVDESTGIKDKNGKEIYETDIVKCRVTNADVGEITGVIAWGKYRMGFALQDLRGEGFGFVASIRSMWPTMPRITELPKGGIDGEVVGNIHENPNLLK
jgi:uncharacterized phage protein (TIGR01671 family)